MADAATQGLLPHSQTLRTRRVETQVEAILRNRGGGSAAATGSAGSVADATAGPTGVKGKLRLYGHLAGTADAPIIATTATPQITRLAIGTTAATSPYGLYIRATSTLKGVYTADYPETFDFNGMNTVVRQATATYNPANMAITSRQSCNYTRIVARGAGQVNAGGWLANFAQVGDDVGVQKKTIATITAGGLVTTTTSHTYLAGERVVIWDSLDNGTNLATDSSMNDEWIVSALGPTPTTQFYITTSGGSTLDPTASHDGFVTNAPFYFGMSIGVSPIVDRSVLQGGGTNGDDVGGVSVHNSGSGRGTDAYYISNSGGVTGSGWVSGYTMDSDADFGFRVGGVHIGADSSLAAFYEPFGAAFDCSNATLEPGAHAMRLMNSGWIAAKNQAADTFYAMLGVNLSNEICLGDLGTDNTLRFLRNNTTVFSLNASGHAEWATGKRIGIGVDPPAALSFASSTTAAAGMDFGADLFVFRGAAGRLEVQTAAVGTVAAFRNTGSNNQAGILIDNAGGGGNALSRIDFAEANSVKFTLREVNTGGLYNLQVSDPNDANLSFQIWGGNPQALTERSKVLIKSHITSQAGWVGVQQGMRIVMNVSGLDLAIPQDLAGRALELQSNLNLTSGAVGASAVGFSVTGSATTARHEANEIANGIYVARDDTSSGGFHPSVWGFDSGAHGFAGNEQNGMLVNGVFFINNHYSGSPSRGASAGVTITTKYGAGPGKSAAHATSPTFRIDYGLHVCGASGDGTDFSLRRGFDAAIKVGGGGVWWAPTDRSRIGTGVSITDYEAFGLKIERRSTAGGTNPPAISIGWDDAGAASFNPIDGIDFAGTVNLYASSATRLKTDDSMTVAGSELLAGGHLVLNSASGGYVDLSEQSSAPIAPGAGVLRLYIMDGGGTASTFNVKDAGNTVTTLGAGGGFITAISDTATGTGSPIDLTMTGTTLSGELPTTATPQVTQLGIGQAANTKALSFVASTAATGGIDFGGDVELYRIAADRLYTPDAIAVASTDALGVGGNGVYLAAAGRIDITRSAAAVVFRHYNTALGSTSVVTLGDGNSAAQGLRFGPGSGATDVGLYRSNTGVLRTDGSFVAASAITSVGAMFVGTDLAVGGSLSFTAVGGGGFIQQVEQTSAVAAPSAGWLRTYMDNGHLMLKTATQTRIVRADRAADVFTQTYSTADATLGAYTADTESVAYTGAADSEAKLADLNALRVAYENLRAHHEDLAQFTNALVDSLQAEGDVA